jgi:hypothetical protein
LLLIWLFFVQPVSTHFLAELKLFLLPFNLHWFFLLSILLWSDLLPLVNRLTLFL